MKKFAKFAFAAFLMLFFLIIGFYLWASSPNLSPEQYATIYGPRDRNVSSPSQKFSILTYNIGYLSGMTNNLPLEKPKSLFDGNLKLVLENLRSIDADFIALQEIDYDSDRSYNVDQHEEIARLGYPYSAKTINWDKRYVPFPYYPFSMHFGKIISGQSVISKYPIVDQQRIELERNQGNPFYYDSFYLDRLAQVTKVRVAGHNLVIINVHLEAFDQDTRIRQLEKLRTLYGMYCNKMPTIMLGDFNSDIRYDNAGISLLTEMIRTGNAVFEPGRIQNTFDSRQPTERLDYIFYNTEYISEVSARVATEFQEASDHLPVLLTFEFKNLKYGANNEQPDT